MRQNYADLIHKCNVDDDVKVVVIRGEGEVTPAAAATCPEQRDMLENPGMPLHELSINDETVWYPPGDSYRYPYTLTDHYARSAPATGRCRNARRSPSSRPRLLLRLAFTRLKATPTWWCAVRRRAVRPPGVPLRRRLGPRLWWWAETHGPGASSPEMLSPEGLSRRRRCTRVPQQRGAPGEGGRNTEVRDGVFEDAPHRHRRGAEDVPRTLPRHKGEYFGSLLTGVVEGMLPMMTNDRANEVDLTEGTFEKGLNNVVKDNDMNFPPEWRLSRSAARSRDGNGRRSTRDRLPADIDGLRAAGTGFLTTAFRTSGPVPITPSPGSRNSPRSAVAAPGARRC